MSNQVSSMFFRLWINGTEITGHRKECISSFDIDDICDGSSTLTLNIIDPNYVYIEDNIYVNEATIILEHGFVDDPEYDRFSGYISTIDLNFPDNGAPTLTITCFDESHIMNRVKKERSWDKVTRADVVKKVAAEYGYSTYIEPNYEFAVIDTISQSNQTDIEFLESLAGDEREPFLCKLIGTTLHYEKKGMLKEPLVDTLGYNTDPFDVISFNPQINKETRQESITSSDIKASDKSLESFTATDNNVSRDVQGESVKTTTNYTYDPVTRKWTQVKE